MKLFFSIILSFLFVFSCQRQRSRLASKYTEELHNKADDKRVPVVDNKRDLRSRAPKNIKESYDRDEKCKEDRECKKLCRDIYKKDERKCENAPTELVEEIKKIYDNLKYITNSEDLLDSINATDFKHSLEVSNEYILELIDEDIMNQKHISEFLLWVADSEEIAEALKDEDRNHEVMRAAFSLLGDYKKGKGSVGTLKTGLNASLVVPENSDNSFLAVSSLNRNHFAFQIAYNLLENVCEGSNSKNCKLQLLCAREHRKADYRKTDEEAFGHCGTYEGRETSRKKDCYIHGSDVWSYFSNALDETDRDSRIRDRDFSRDYNLDQDICRNFCKNGLCKKTY